MTGPPTGPASADAAFSAARLTIFTALLTLAIAGTLAFASRSYHTQRLSDLRQIVRALEAYRRDHAAYPVAAAVSLYDGSRPPRQQWIPGLSPTYLKVVPRDPRRLTAASKQYLFMSDGKDYKIIAHGAEDAPYVVFRRPELNDQRRPGSAYGYWTEGARAW